MSVRGRIIGLVLFLEVVLMATAAFLFIDEHNDNEQQAHQYISNSLKNQLQRNAADTQKRYANRIAGFVKSNQEVISAFIQHDREQLARRVEKRIETLSKEDDFFFSLTFAYKDGTVFYHSKTPEREGRNVSHIPFARDSFAAQKPRGGLVLSLAGLAYRYSYPVFDGDEYIGMAVIVIEPTRAITRLQQDFNAQSAILIERDYIDRFENKDVTFVGNKALVATAGEEFSNPDFLAALGQNPQTEAVELLGRTFQRLSRLPLENYEGSVIGEIITVLDVTEMHESYHKSLVNAGTLFVIIFLLTLVVLYVGIGFFLKQLQRLQQNLEVKVHKRTRALQEVNAQLSSEIQERKRIQATLEDISEKDVLTRVYNRRKFDTYYTTEWNAAKREKRVISLLMVDIDCFKAYNDCYGHLAGDEALIDVATVIHETVSRPRDLVARYGGEEFVCVLPETTMDAAVLLAEKMRERVETLCIPHAESSNAEAITVSIGVASLIPEPSQTKEDLVQMADKALYKAKNSGRNSTKVA
jgi:diguanylate cyclase (GGDEF)-like protein